MEEAAPDAQSSPATPPVQRSRSGRWRLLIVLLLAVALIVAARLLPVKGYLIELLARLDRVKQLGLLGPMAVVGVYIVACVLFIPGSVLTLGAGFIFGLWVGTATVSVGSVLGAGAAFLVGRTVARDWIARKVAGSPKFAALDDAVGRQGFKIVLLTRLSPVFPFNLLNYAYGVTGVSFGHYVLASWIGMLPGTIMYVYIGSTLGSLAEAVAERTERTAGEQIFFYAGLVVTIVVTIFITRVARKALKQKISAGPEAS